MLRFTSIKVVGLRNLFYYLCFKRENNQILSWRKSITNRGHRITLNTAGGFTEYGKCLENDT